MGNIFVSNKESELKNKIKDLEIQINDLKTLIKDNNDQEPRFNKKNIDSYIDDWYKKNKEVDIGIIELPLIGKVDFLPDKIEKHIYKKTLLIISSLLEELLNNLDVNLLNKKIKVVII